MTAGQLSVWGMAAVLFLAEAPAREVSQGGRAITVDADRADWADTAPYPGDTTGEAGIRAFDVDWKDVTLAHDAQNLYLRVRVREAADFAAYPAFYNVFLDTDRNRATGYVGGSEQFSIGADLLLQGYTLFAFQGSSRTDFQWSPLGMAAGHTGVEGKDLEIALPRGLLNDCRRFDFILYADNALSQHAPDYYPDDADRGASGSFFTYALDDSASKRAGTASRNREDEP